MGYSKRINTEGVRMLKKKVWLAVLTGIIIFIFISMFYYINGSEATVQKAGIVYALFGTLGLFTLIALRYFKIISIN